MFKKFICIDCPMGCHLTITIEDDSVKKVEGNACRRGIEYAQQEAICPMRILTSLMPIANRYRPLSVKTDSPVPKAKLLDCAAVILNFRPSAPIRCGEIMIKNICDTGANVISTQDVE